MDLELSAWGDGTIRLVFWDSIYGHDRIFILDADGVAYEEDANDQRQSVNLVLALRAMTEDETDESENPRKAP